MSKQSAIHKEMLQLFGEAYRAFGLNRQMGRIVALLMMSPEPLSLDEITKQLGLSKGPVSQLTRRLLERNIVRKVWNPGSRKDYFEIQPQSFSNAFGNFVDLIKHNVVIAKHLISEIHRRESEQIPQEFYARLVEMQNFFGMMEQSFHTFLGEWTHKRVDLYDTALHPDTLSATFSKATSDTPKKIKTISATTQSKAVRAKTVKSQSTVKSTAPVKTKKASAVASKISTVSPTKPQQKIAKSKAKQ